MVCTCSSRCCCRSPSCSWRTRFTSGAWTPSPPNRWAVDGDHSWIEALGYLQIVAAGVLFFLGWWRREGLVYIGWQVTPVVIVVDDALLAHELGGGWLVRQGVIPSLFGLPRQALGELVAWALMGIPALLVL